MQSIGSYAFSGCTGLTEVKLPEGLASIGSYGFRGCTGLKSITVPASMQSISSYAFSGCTGLTEVKLPEGLTSIYSYAFQDCDSLERVDFPASVTALSALAFYNCDRLSEIGYPTGWESVPDYYRNSTTRYGDGDSYYRSPFEGCVSLKKIEVPEGVESVPKYAFRYQTSVEEVVLPESLTGIGAYAFDGCSGLKTVNLPDAVASIGSYGFRGCTGLKSITLPASMQSISSYTFYGCTAFTSVTLPSNVQSIGSYAFSGCTGLTEVKLPEGLTSIYSYAFQDCDSLERVDFPASVTALSALAFYNCDRLSEIGYPTGWESVPDYYRNSTTRYGDGDSYYRSPFEGCVSLKKIEVPEGVESVPKYAFRYQTSVEEVVLPESVTGVGAYAFDNCTALEKIWVPQNTVSIEKNAFAGCGNLTIHGIADSYAQEYAEQNGVPFSTELMVYPMTTISGMIQDPDGKGVPDVTVTLYDLTTGELQETVKSDEDGTWSNPKVIIGHSYQIWFYHKNYNISEFSDIVAATEEPAEIPAVTATKKAEVPETSADDFTYAVLNGSYCQVTGYTGTETAIQIPSEMDGYIVQSIGDGAFRDNKELERVVFPDSLETMGDNVFNGCTGLTEVSFNDGLTNIGSSAFRSCTALKDINLPASIQSIEDYAFMACTGFTSVTLPSSVQSIGSYAFSGCTGLTEVNLPEGLTSIYSYAFQDCDSLERVDFPASVTVLSALAFYNCDRLSEIGYPTGWESVPDYYRNSTTRYGDGDSYYRSPFEGCVSLKKIEIPEGVESVPKYAFRYQTSVEEVVLPESLTGIGAYAFDGCSGLKTVNLPDAVASIGSYGFRGCTGLKSITVPASMQSISSYAFSGCTGLTEVKLPEGLTSIYSYAFQDCDSLERVDFPASVTALSALAFYNCDRLSEIGYPTGWESVPDYYRNSTTRYGDGDSYYRSPFEGCVSLKKIEVPEGVESVPKYAFRYQTSVEEVVLPESLTGIGAYAFDGCSGLKTVNLPDAVASIGSYGFRGCTGLKSITLPASMQSISSYTFYGCTAFTSVTLPSNVQSIGSYAFSGCTGLTEVKLPEGLTSIYSYAFQDCDSLERVDFPASVTALSALAFYNCDRLSEIGYPTGWESVPDYYRNSTTRYGDGDSYYRSPFEGCVSLKKIEVPEGVESVPKYAFRYQTSVEEVVLPESVTGVGAYAFDNCTALEKIWVPQNTVSIEKNAFAGCGNLTIHGIADSYAQEYAEQNGVPFSTELMVYPMTTISGMIQDPDGKGVPDVTVTLYDLTTGELQETVKSDEDGTWSNPKVIIGHSYQIWFYHKNYNISEFSDIVAATEEPAEIPAVTATKKAEVPETSADDFTYAVLNGSYCQVTGYTGTETAIQIPSEMDGYIVQSIGDGAFRDNKELERVVFPDSLETMGDNVFNGCTGLTEVSFNDGLTNIGSSAFRSCTALKDINLPASIQSIEDYAFMACTGFTSVTLPSSVQSIGSYAFSGCTGLTEVNLPEGLTSIYSYAFQDCDSLERVDFPASVTVLSALAFYNCDRLSEIGYPTGWESVPDYYRNSTTRYGDGDSYYRSPFEGCVSLKKIEIPEGVESVPKYAFRYQTSVEEVVLPESLTGIGAYAFDGCSGLKTVNLPDAVASIGSYGFRGCTGLKSITVPASMQSISSYAFSGCTGLTEVKLPEGLTSIYSYAFQDCDSLERVDFPASVTALSALAFYNCDRLSEIGYPTGWESVPDYYRNSTTRYGDGDSYYRSPFEGCAALKKIEVPEGVESVPKYAFRYQTSVEEVVLPESLTGIGAYAFDGCSSLNSVNLVEGITEIPAYAFRNCINLNVLTLPSTLERVGNSAFYGCRGLRLINMDDNLQAIGSYAFYGCSGLVSLVLNNGLTTISDNAFAACTNLTAVEIPKSVTEMSGSSFSSCSKLTIYCYSGSAAHQACESGNYTFSLLDAHEHQYEITIETSPTCTRGGSQILTCSVCGYNYIEVLAPLGHQEGDWVVQDATCTEEGVKIKYCTVCNQELAREYIPAKGHTWSEWTVESEASVLVEGKKNRTCSVCQESEEVVTPKTQVDVSENTAYGLAQITVVDAATKEPLSGASVQITTESEGDALLFTDENGYLAQILPIGIVNLSVYAEGYNVRNISVQIYPGVNTIPTIGISTGKLVEGILTSSEMTPEEMQELGISAGSHIYKYELKLTFEAQIDMVSIAYYMNPTTHSPEVYLPASGSGGGGSGGSSGYKAEIIIDPLAGASDGKTGVGVKYTSDNGKTISVYPVNEQFYLIIRGEVGWTKEIYDVELLAVNNSLTDTVENATAELVLPDGLSLAQVNGGQQSALQNIGNLAEGENKSVHWYVQGDEEGSYNVTAILKGTMMPFGETFEYKYTAASPLKVYAGSAMHMTFYVPDAAFHDDDYTVRIELENVSDKVIYNVRHRITDIEQYKITYYSDGTQTTTDYDTPTDNDRISVPEFYPGDKLIMEVPIRILFESEMIQNQLESFLGSMQQFKQLLNAYKAVSTGIGLFTDLFGYIRNSSKILDDFISGSKVIDAVKKQVCLKLVDELSKLLEKCTNSPDNEVIKAIEKLKDSDLANVTNVWDTLIEICDVPAYLDMMTVEEIATIISRLKATIDSIDQAEAPELSAYDAMEQAIELIPIRYVLVNSSVTTLEGSSTEIPTSIEITPTGAHYFGVDNVSDYLYNLMITCFGEYVETDSFLKNFGFDAKEIMGYDDAVQYITAANEKATHFLASDNTETGEFSAWYEPAAAARTASDEQSCELSVDNPTAQWIDGKLTFSGAGMIELIPHNGAGGTLYVQMPDGNIKSFVIKVVEAHTCASDTWEVLIPPTDTTDGVKAKCCDICGTLIAVEEMRECGHHNFGEYQTEVKATFDTCEMEGRTCTECGTVEYKYSDAYSLNGYVYEFNESTTADNIINIFKDRGLEVSMPGVSDIQQSVSTGAELMWNDSAYELVVFGDVNCDTEINVFDVVEVINHLGGNKKLTGASFRASLSDYYKSEPDIFDIEEMIDKIEGAE